MNGGKYMSDNIAANIREISKNKGIKLKKIAENVGVSEKSFSNMLNGRGVIKAQYIPAIASTLNVTADDLFGFSSGDRERG